MRPFTQAWQAHSGKSKEAGVPLAKSLKLKVLRSPMVERSRRKLLARTLYSFCILICLLSVSTAEVP